MQSPRQGRALPALSLKNQAPDIKNHTLPFSNLPNEYIEVAFTKDDAIPSPTKSITFGLNWFLTVNQYLSDNKKRGILYCIQPYWLSLGGLAIWCMALLLPLWRCWIESRAEQGSGKALLLINQSGKCRTSQDGSQRSAAPRSRIRQCHMVGIQSCHQYFGEDGIFCGRYGHKTYAIALHQLTHLDTS